MELNRFKQLLESSMGNVKPLISEDKDMMAGDSNWSKILAGLKTYNNPKVINFNYDGKPYTSLNWGTHSEAGKNKNWGFSLTSDGSVSFQTKEEDQASVFESTMGVETDYNNTSGTYSYFEDMDYSNPTGVITKVKSLITSLG